MLASDPLTGGALLDDVEAEAGELSCAKSRPPTPLAVKLLVESSDGVGMDRVRVHVLPANEAGTLKLKMLLLEPPALPL